MSTETAILAGGCFWGVQDLVRRQPGVLSTRVGYSGGEVPNATYRNHGNHAEAIEIVFDPAGTSYRKDGGLDLRSYVAEAGFLVATISYRTVLNRATYRDGVADVKSAIRFLRARILLSDPRPDHEEPAGQRCRGELSFGDLLHK